MIVRGLFKHTTGPTVKPFDCVPPTGGTMDVAMLMVFDTTQTIPTRAAEIDAFVVTEVRTPAVVDVNRTTGGVLVAIGLTDPPEVVAGTFTPRVNAQKKAPAGMNDTDCLTIRPDEPRPKPRLDCTLVVVIELAWKFGVA